MATIVTSECKEQNKIIEVCQKQIPEYHLNLLNLMKNL